MGSVKGADSAGKLLKGEILVYHRMYDCGRVRGSSSDLERVVRKSERA